MPIVRRVMEQLDGKPIVSIYEHSVPKYVTHEGMIVGVMGDDGKIEWFDNDKAREAKLILRKDKIKKIIDNDK